MSDLKISISHGNRKMGEIPSVSLPPVITCAAGCTCARKCYAVKLCRIYKSTRNAYSRNLELLTTDPESYWDQVIKAVSVSRYFRFHVSGDIPNDAYLHKLIGTAIDNPHCEILCFTKQYDMVNRTLNGIDIPENLHLIFSEWPGMKINNPYSLPVAHVVFRGQEPAENWKVCGGNCSECACRGVGCWELKRGEEICFYEH